MASTTVATEPVITIVPGRTLGHVPGFKSIGIAAGIKKRGGKDLGLVVSDRPAECAGVFTQNKVAAAPVIVSRKVGAEGLANAIVVNSGNANAATGAAGLVDALAMQQAAAAALHVPAETVFVASTGVIGKRLPIDKIIPAIAQAVAALDGPPDDSLAQAIVTTDLSTKQCFVRVDTPAGAFHVAGVAKGSGMISPNMATMLAFVATDLGVHRDQLQVALRTSTERSYNRVSVDHDTSTNDMALVMANGASGLQAGVQVPPAVFQSAIDLVNVTLAKAIAADGEGATKLITVHVSAAATTRQANCAAKAVVDSPLVKTAMHGADPNWGRIVAALGACGVQLDPDKLAVAVGSRALRVGLVRTGTAAQFDARAAHDVLAEAEVEVHVDLGVGYATGVAYGCDLGPRYVEINAHYTT